MATWLGVEPLTDARRVDDGVALRAGIKKSEREKLSAVERSKLKARAEEGLSYKFDIIRLEETQKSGQDRLKTVYSVTLRLEEFYESLLDFDMDDVFTIPSAFVWKEDDEEWWPDDDAVSIDLRYHYGDVDLDTVKQASTFFTLRGQDYHVQNLQWSATKLLNSCSQELREKIEEEARTLPQAVRSGPVYLKIMLEKILLTTPRALRLLLQELQTLGVKDFQGESVSDYVSSIRGVVNLLNNHSGVEGESGSLIPPDMVTLIGDGLKRCSHQEFVRYIEVIMATHEAGSTRVDIEGLLKLAEKKCQSYIASNQWLSQTQSAAGDNSVFFAGKCYNCGKEGHRARDCKSPSQNSDSNPRGDSGGRGSGGRGGRGRG